MSRFENASVRTADGNERGVRKMAASARNKRSASVCASLAVTLLVLVTALRPK